MFFKAVCLCLVPTVLQVYWLVASYGLNLTVTQMLSLELCSCWEAGGWS